MIARNRKHFSVLLLFTVLALVAAACGSDEDSTPATAAATQATTTTAAMAEEAPTTTEAMEEAPATTEAMEEEAPTTTEAMEEEMMGTMADVPMYDTWDDVLAAADGTTVNWHMWGGNENLNSWVDTYIGDVVKERYNVTLNRVPLGDTVEAVNLVLNEHQAGVTEGGSVDMIWINGDNFKTLKEAELLFGPWSEGIPNAAHVNWDDPSIAYDFGVSVDGLESPWGSAQMVFVYNSAYVPEPPRTFEALAEWVHANPGLFTYTAPPDFHGLSFVKHMFYWAADDYSVFQQPFDQAVFDSIAPKVWEYLNDIEPDLWRGGDTYPTSIGALQDLLANSEVYFGMSLNPRRPSTLINNGTYPDTIRTWVMDTGTLTNKNYVTIPKNASNPAGAMIVANHILSTENQLIQANPEQWGWGLPTDTTTWTQEERDILNSYDRGVATLPFDVLAAAGLPEPHASWPTQMEAGWIENVLEA